MATLTWDDYSARTFQTGVDKGVLYLQDGTVVAWNGLTSVEDSSTGERKSYYLDGVKFLENLTPRDFVGKLKAYTYPEEFDVCMGIVPVVGGFEAYEQPPQSFSLSYRTKIGNDLQGVAHGYKIHILYNLLADPDSYAYATIDDSGGKPIEFSWNLSGTPPKVDRFRPTVHVAVDSTTTPPEVLKLVEDKLYGTMYGANPSLPTFQELEEFFGFLGALIITDDGNGVWTAIDESNGYITMLDDTTFFIDHADVTYLDSNTYTISSTNVI